jgi:hypothetical protein
MRVSVRVSTATACNTWRGWTGPRPASPSFCLPLAITISGIKLTNESSAFFWHSLFRIYGIPESFASIGEATKLEFLSSFLINFKRVIVHRTGWAISWHPVQFKVSPKVEPWPLAELPWGLTGDYDRLGVTMVIDDPHKWEGPKIVLAGGTKAMFKFVHKNAPIMTSVHLYDHQVSWYYDLCPPVWPFGKLLLWPLYDLCIMTMTSDHDHDLWPW